MVIDRGELADEVMWVLVVDQPRVLVRSARLQQLRIPRRSEEERLEARHHVYAEQPTGEGVHRHEHFPIDQAALRFVAESILVIVLAVDRPPSSADVNATGLPAASDKRPFVCLAWDS